MDLWRQMDPKMPFIQRLEFIKKSITQIKVHADRREIVLLLGFVKYLEAVCYGLTDGEDKNLTVPIPPYVKIEHIHMLKELIKDRNLGYRIADPQKSMIFIFRTDGFIPRLSICDGCRVNEPHEHRCHKGQMRINDEPARKSCECPECLETELLRNLGAMSDKNFMEKISIINKLEGRN